MGFFSNLIKQQVKRFIEQEQPRVQISEEEDAEFSASMEAFRLLEEAHADTEYQQNLERYNAIMSTVYEKYSVINAVGSFLSDEGNALITLCAEAINIEIQIKEKRDYYQSFKFEVSEPCKYLAMIYEKRGEYERAATICVFAIENGFAKDGTKGGMRGRLARMIKKGDLPLTDNIKNILNL